MSRFAVSSARMEPSPVFDRRCNLWSARRCSGRQLSLLGLLFMVVLTRPASSEVFLNDSSVEISGTSIRMSRSCTVLLKPTQTFGDNAAPRLTLVTTGNAQLSYGLEKPAQYANQVIVQNNVRRAFVMAENASIEQFRGSDIGKAIKSRRLFFVTAQLAGGKYVSSRYDRIDFDVILAKIETVCPFDAESLMADHSSREQAERSLRISPSDLTLIRWALIRKYGGLVARPDPTSSLLSQERTYLKRYASDNGLVISQFLSADSARRLTADGQLLATPVPTPTPTPTPTLTPSPAAPDFYWYQNTDFDGDDIKPWLMNYSPEECRSACSATAACRAFTYNKRRNVCILKTGTGTVKPSVEAVSASRTPVSVVRGRITVQNGMDLPGGDFDTSGLRNLSFEQCQSACLDNASCVGFSYVKSRRWCWPKRQVLDRRLNNDVVSGVK